MKISKLELQELIDIKAGIPADGTVSENCRVRLKNKGLVYRDNERPWRWHLTEDGVREYENK